MAKPIIELIAENIEAAVNQITVANGYQQTLSAIRPKKNDFAYDLPENNKVLILQSDEEVVKPPTAYKRWRAIFGLTAIVIDSDAETESIDSRLNRITADIEKKLKEDNRRGENAISTEVESCVFFSVEKCSGSEIRVAVEYQTKFDDPYSL